MPRVTSVLAAVIPIGLLAAGTLVSCYVFVAPGQPVTVDAWPHLSRIKIVYESFRAGHATFWSFMFYSGYPAFGFYSPLFYAVGGALALATRGDALLALRILLVSLQVLSAAAMFLFIRRRTGDVQAASLGSLVYVYVPWRAHHLGGHANYPQALIYLGLPLMFLIVDRLIARPDRRTALALGVVVSLGLLSHVVYAATAVAFLCIVLLLGFPWSVPGGLTSGAVRKLMLAALAVLLLSAFLLVPFLAEYRSHAFPQPLGPVPGSSPLSFLGFMPRPRGAPGGYLGISVLCLLLTAIATTAARSRGRYAQSVTLSLSLSFLFAFVIPKFGATGAMLALKLPPERSLVFFLFFAAVLIGLLWPVWKVRVKPLARFSLPAFVLLVEIIGLDCTKWNLLNYNFPKEQFLGARPMVYPVIAAQDHAKMLDVASPTDQIDNPARTSSFAAAGYLFGGLPSPAGSYSQFASRSMLYCHPWINAVAVDLGDTTTRFIAARTRKALALMGVSHVLMSPRVLGGSTAEDSLQPRLLKKEGIHWDTRFVKPGARPYLAFGATGAGLVLASNRIRPVPAEHVIPAASLCIADDWQALLDSVSLDDGINVISYIPVTMRDRPDSLPGYSRLGVASTSIRNQDVTARVTASSECFLRVALSYHPELRVTIDGNAVQFGETKDHFIYLRCPKGTHVVGVTAPLTTIRLWTLAVSALAALLLVLGLALPQAGDLGRH